MNQNGCALGKFKKPDGSDESNRDCRAIRRSGITLDCLRLGVFQLLAVVAAGLCFAPKLP